MEGSVILCFLVLKWKMQSKRQKMKISSDFHNFLNLVLLFSSVKANSFYVLHHVVGLLGLGQGLNSLRIWAMVFQ